MLVAFLMYVIVNYWVQIVLTLLTIALFRLGWTYRVEIVSGLKTLGRFVYPLARLITRRILSGLKALGRFVYLRSCGNRA